MTTGAEERVARSKFSNSYCSLCSDCKSPQVVEIPGTRRSQKQDAPAEGIALKIGDPAHGTNHEVELTCHKLV